MDLNPLTSQGFFSASSGTLTVQLLLDHLPGLPTLFGLLGCHPPLHESLGLSLLLLAFMTVSHGVEF